MVIGAIIALVSAFIGYFVRGVLEYRMPEEMKKEFKRVFASKKGLVVDMTEPIDIGEIETDEKGSTIK